ncbi:MAG: DUF5076 domain-containing protein [Alphaproteobacteria bacterium]|jgi:hypothetical protein|nr:DUF5076 domain-containing protein [Alphaproteobacteria bacterium]
MSDHPNALKLPDGVTPGDDAQEMLRFWIANNQPASQLFVGGADAAREPGMWGFILADIAKHVVQTLRADNPDGPEAQALLEQIMANFIERLKHDPELAAVVTRTES